MAALPGVVKVEPITTARVLRGPFDYQAPEGAVVGTRLIVPFGRRDVPGVVTGLAPDSAFDVVAPRRVLEPSLPAELVELAFWLADEYCSTPARALALLAPHPRMRSKTALYAEPAGEAAVSPRAPGKTVNVASPSLSDGEATFTVAGPRLNDGQRALLDSLPRFCGPDTAALRRLEARGLVEISPRVVRRAPAHLSVGAERPAPGLTADQASAVAAIGASAPGEQLLLHWATGSGKTEVYLHAVQAALAAGRSAIVLVPEIALTPQVLWRFQARFGDVVAVLHSALSVGERHDEWLRLASGEARVCVGPRSAVFAPFSNLGLIIVDEEHESSYKHEGDPRYDARSVAQQRARQTGAVLVCGSATPRPESMLALKRLRLPERVDGRPLPAVEVLDMRGHHQPLHPATRMALADLRRAGGKAILLLNRRGWSNFLSCRACGRVWQCPNCEVALVLHRSGSFLACHHCGHRERVPTRCGSCGSVSVARHGAGTERIEHELRDALGGNGFPIFRLDADSATLERRAGTLQRFAASGSGVLVGTQMVAKGHDFPDVSLGVVLDADQTLRFPDFRAEERTFALVTQLAGRTGRGAAGGRVLVQTLAPEARSIAFATVHDSDGFLADELKRRQALRYPPFTALIRVVCAAEDEFLSRKVASEVAAELAPLGSAVLGPAPLFRLRGRARTQLVVKATDRRAAIDAVGRAVDTVAPGAARQGASVSVDVDPQ
ncbi:MAG: replication restart helicase PriA [Solirubrobacteraceae bacterium]